MIKLDMSLAIALYLSFSVVGILILWLFLDRVQKPKKYFSENKFIWECEICKFTYIDSQHDIISKCSRCGSLNKRQPQVLPENEGGQEKEKGR